MPAMNQRTRWLGRKRLRTRLLVTLVFLTTWLAAAQSPSQDPATLDLPVTRLALFTSGVGYFEHTGVVEGDQEMLLTLPKAEMDDFLQSLVLQDFGGGTIEPVRYSSQAPLGRLLDAYALDLSSNVTLLELLAQARGEQVRLEGPSTIEGALLGVEEQRTTEGTTRAFVTVATAEGVRRVALEDVSAVRFLDPELAADIDAALATIVANRDDDSATVRLRFSGEGQREVRVGYVREMPVWKSTYRLVVGDDGKGTLQGWAIVDNPTDEPLENVQLSFVAGQPISFITSLYQPVWAVRPRVEVKATGGLVPDIDVGQSADGITGMLRESAADASFSAAPVPVAPAPQMSGAGVTGQAQTAATASSFVYHVEEPVTIGRNESALVPLVVAEVTAERLALFDRRNHARHPLHAVRLVNDTGLQLAAGSVTIYDEVGFAGNAQLPELLPDEERLLAFAVDLELAVTVASGQRSTSVTRAAIRGNLLEVTELTRQTMEITVSGAPSDGRFLVVQTPALPGFDIVEPRPAPPLSNGQPRFGVALVGADGAVPDDRAVPTHLVCRAGGACTLEVVAERLDSQSLALANLASDRLAIFLENVELSDEDRAVLDQIVSLQRELAEADRQLERTGREIQVIFQEQQRIRSNMTSLDRDSDLYRRYVTELTEQEDTLAELRGLERQQQEERDSLQRRLDELVSRLGG